MLYVCNEWVYNRKTSSHQHKHHEKYKCNIVSPSLFHFGEMEGL